jgi:hypothetical protein
MGLIAFLLLAAAVAGAEVEGEVVELIPDERASWGATNVFAPITGFFLGGPGYWYGKRSLEVETTPPGAMLELFYVRASFQKGYEQAEAPAIIVLPRRVEAGPRDSVTIRALADGYRVGEVYVRVRSRQSKVMIDLEPLPNSLVAVTHTYFAGRAALVFLTKEASAFRLQKGGDGIAVVLAETATTPEADEAIEGVRSVLVSSLRARQLGEDLLLQVALGDEAREEVEIRSRQSYDPVRNLHSFALDFVPPDKGVGAVRRARAALGRIRASHVAGCAETFDEALRQQLDLAALSRALAPKGAFTDPFLRAAMKRLGEVSPDGLVSLIDGSSYRIAAPIELAAATNRAAEVVGYLALLRQLVAELEPEAFRRQMILGLIAPEVRRSRFDAILDGAEKRERGCLAKAKPAELARYSPPAPGPAERQCRNADLATRAGRAFSTAPGSASTRWVPRHSVTRS